MIKPLLLVVDFLDSSVSLALILNIGVFYNGLERISIAFQRLSSPIAVLLTARGTQIGQTERSVVAIFYTQVLLS